MIDEPRIIFTGLDILFVAKAIGAHINHIATLIVDSSNRYSASEQFHQLQTLNE